MKYRWSVIAALWLLVAVPAVAGIRVTETLTGLDRPVRLVAPQGDDRLFVVQQGGQIRVFDPDGADRGVFLDVTLLLGNSGGERGLLGLAFPPDYATTGRFYINYTNTAGDTRIARYQVSGDPDVALPASAEVLLAVDQPFGNHNGGHLDFGPDGMLYIGLGDGGSGGDPGNRAQNPQELLGKMLRIDVSGATGYVVPPDNPFVGEAPLDEIWALGLRNPWCFDFDAVTGDLYIADVGQEKYEEISIQPSASTGGENYGWRLMEAADCFNPATNCNDGSLTLPVWSYDHNFGCSISGGYVYRGTALPGLVGQYLFADFCSTRIWSIGWTPTGGIDNYTEWTDHLTPPGGYRGISAFGEDGHGELYVLDLFAGIAYRIEPTPSDVPEVEPRPFLGQNTPNPFNPRTVISYELATGGRVTLQVFDAAGRLVTTLVDGERGAGPHRAAWNGTDDSGREVGTGVYFYRLRQAGEIRTRKMTLIR